MAVQTRRVLTVSPALAPGCIDHVARRRGHGIRKRSLQLLREHAALVFAITAVIFWLSVAMLTHTSLRGDNVEQSVWMHGLEWGYYKHPPLTTWLLIAASSAAGSPWWLTNLLGGLCLLGTAFVTYAVALLLVPRRTARLAIVLWGLHLTVTWRADLYNHNSVLVLLCALLAWAVISATQKRESRYWLLAGAFAGTAMLAKYQVAVLVVVMLVALARAGHLSDPFHRRGMLAGGLLALALFMPHVLWLADHHFAPLHYASTQLPRTWSWSPFEQGAVVSFCLQQLRLFWPALAGALICVALARADTEAVMKSNLAGRNNAESNRAWVQALTLGPIMIVLAFGLAGTQLQNHWGMQTLQFSCLGLAVWLARRSSVRPNQLMAVAGALHLLLLATVLHDFIQVSESGWQGRGDKFYPARQLAGQALADWRRATACPLRYVVGPQFEAGTIAVYSGFNPLVMEDGSSVASPWIDRADVLHQGALYVAYTPEQLPRDSMVSGSMLVTAAEESKRPRTVHWGVVPPEAPCWMEPPLPGSGRPDDMKLTAR